MDVVCLGILVADVFAEPVNALPRAGELGLTDGFILSAGGCAANVAVALRRLGRQVSVAGKVGQDWFGEFAISDLQRHGVDTMYVSRGGNHPTSATVILCVRGDDRRYLHCIGANADFRRSDVDLAMLDGRRVLHVGGYLAMPGWGCEDLVWLLREAKARGLTTVLDLVIPAGKSNPLPEVEAALPYCDYFLPNDDEAFALTGLRDPEEQARALAAYHPEGCAIVTLGRRGSVACKEGQLITTQPFPMESVDESGAGDAFAAGLITGILENWPLPQSLRFAGVVGASCTRALGCIAGVFPFEEARAYFETH
ncbi:MAG: sugar kinase [Bryobacteraceae bacterium]